MNLKRIVKIIIFTYVIGIVIFNVMNYLIFIAFPKVKDWELFSYNFYGSLIFYSISAVLFYLISWIYDIEKLGEIKASIILIVLLDISSILVAGQSILLTIVTTMISDRNYILVFYPIIILITYKVSKVIIK